MPTIPCSIQCSKFFHPRSKNLAYANALEKLLPDFCAFLKYSFISNNLEPNYIILVIKQGGKIFEEKIKIKDTNDELKFVSSDKSRFHSLKEYLEQKRTEWQKKYKKNLTIVCNFELARDQEMEKKIDENLIKIAEDNLNNFLKNSPEKISDIFRLPKKLPASNYLIQWFYQGHYLVSFNSGYFIISNTEIQQLINLTEKKEKKVTFSQKTPNVSPDYFAPVAEITSDQSLYELSLEADTQSQEAEKNKQKLEVAQSSIFKKPEIKLYYEPDSQESLAQEELSAQLLTQRP